MTSQVTGAPLAGVRVALYRPPGGDSFELPVLSSTVTDAAGRYRLTSAERGWLRSDPPPGHLQTWWHPDRGQLRPIVQPGTSQIDMALHPGHVIRGKVVGEAGAALSNVRVNGWGYDDAVFDDHAVNFDGAVAITDADGGYALTVPTRSIRLSFDPPEGHIRQYWRGIDDMGGDGYARATPLEVRDDLAGIDARLLVGHTVRGSVTDQAGTFLRDVEVVVHRGGGAPCCVVVAKAVSDYWSAYSVQLPPGAYRILFRPPRSAFVAQWWEAAAEFATARDIVVRDAPVSDINARLRPASP